MMKVILYGLLAWFLFNLVFRFIIPVYKTTREMKKKFREMHAQMNEQTTTSTHPDFSRPAAAEKPVSKKTGDYIDFEEVK